MKQSKQVPRILYHGTTKEYVEEVITKYDKYVNPGENGLFLDVWLSDRTISALIHADIYASKFKADPVLLIINSSNVTSKIEYDLSSNYLKCSYIDANSFQMIELKELIKKSSYDNIVLIIKKIEQGEK